MSEEAKNTPQKNKVAEETFSVDEIVNASNALFNGQYKPYLVAAALKECANARLTKAEAIAKVTAFADRKVGN
ncbi:hypothetical protein [Anaerovibrio sp. RM50]|uniref:hypothetical protein n=1 Tax=Anaerovibrio sp. RM50 TaxID=1200557 RepID=UPI000482026F|nr:hypothetical protein [Anaerovibrio sp. RM50]